MTTPVQLNNPQIKYLRVPDTLLDTVKEEQTRAREAGRSARGGGGGAGMRGGASEPIALQLQVRHTDHDPFARSSPLSLHDTPFSWDIDMLPVISTQAEVLHQEEVCPFCSIIPYRS
jgi:hypothetical protein